MNWNNIIDLIEKAAIPVIIGWVTLIIAKKQIVNSGITQFRQRWIDELRKCISVYISKAEMIISIDPEDEESYFEHFKELVATQYQIELMLNPNENDHNELVVIVNNIRALIHNEKMGQDLLEKSLDHKVKQLLTTSKKVLKTEWKIVKHGK